MEKCVWCGSEHADHGELEDHVAEKHPEMARNVNIKI